MSASHSSVARELHQQALRQLQSGETSSALFTLQQALRQDSGFVPAWISLSEILWQLGETSPALDALKQALRLDPHHADARTLLANIQRQTGDVPGATETYRQVLDRHPGHLAAAVNLASLLRSLGDSRGALTLLANVVATGNVSPQVRFNYANALSDCGEFEAAEQHYELALADHPQPAKVRFNFSAVHRFTEQDRNRLQDWESKIRSQPLAAEDNVHLQFALGKAFDDLREYEQAFHHYREGNEAAGIRFDSAAHREQIDRIRRVWTGEFLAGRREWSESGSRMIFIIGMPRSGTTLVEQILAAHSQVAAAGEREDLGRLIAGFAQESGKGDDWSTAARELVPESVRELARGYLQTVADPFPEPNVTDKMPTNFLHLGWIALLFPGARILHCRRDPRDVCLSCYFQHFTSRLPFAYRLEDLVEYYRDYERLMAHWNENLPLPVHDVIYEDLVADPETECRRILEAVGLNWEPGCLQSHRQNRPVATASQWQVRQPIYTTSRRRWERYRPWIAPLLEAFGETS